MKDIILIALFVMVIVAKLLGYITPGEYLICAFIFIHSFFERENYQKS